MVEHRVSIQTLYLEAGTSRGSGNAWCSLARPFGRGYAWCYLVGGNYLSSKLNKNPYKLFNSAQGHQGCRFRLIFVEPMSKLLYKCTSTGIEVIVYPYLHAKYDSLAIAVIALQVWQTSRYCNLSYIMHIFYALKISMKLLRRNTLFLVTRQCPCRVSRLGSIEQFNHTSN